VSDAFLDYGRKVAREATELGFRVEVDERSETVNNKIRQAEVLKVPYMLVVGKREADGGTVSVREHTKGDQGATELAGLLKRFEERRGKGT